MGEEDQFAFTEQRKSLYDVNTDLLTRVKRTGCTVGLEIHRIKDRTTDTSWWCSGEREGLSLLLYHPVSAHKPINSYFHLHLVQSQWSPTSPGAHLGATCNLHCTLNLVGECILYLQPEINGKMYNFCLRISSIQHACCLQ